MLAFPLEKEMATHSSFLAWIIPWTVEPGQLQSMVRKESYKAEHTTLTYSFSLKTKASDMHPNVHSSIICNCQVMEAA